MENYIRNRACRCVRCMAWDLMGSAMLITLGALFLLSTMAHIRFHNTFPVVLIVIGVVLFLRSTGSTAGHIQPGGAAASTPPPAGASETPESKDPSHG